MSEHEVIERTFRLSAVRRTGDDGRLHVTAEELVNELWSGHDHLETLLTEAVPGVTETTLEAVNPAKDVLAEFAFRVAEGTKLGDLSGPVLVAVGTVLEKRLR